MTTSQFHHPQTEDTKEEEWGAVSQGTVSEGREVQLEWTQDDGCPARLGNTVWKELREQWVIHSSCQGLATVTSELFCTECTGARDPPLHLGRSHDANGCRGRPEEQWVGEYFITMTLSPWNFGRGTDVWVNLHFLWGLTRRISALLEGHFINHIESNLVRGERKRKHFPQKESAPLSLPVVHHSWGFLRPINFG